METLRRIFDCIGVDYEETMARFVSNEAMYLKCLDLYFKDESLENLKKSLASKDFEMAFLHAHTLKGITSTMGFVHLYELVCVMVEPLRNRDETMNYEPLLQDIVNEADRIKTIVIGGGYL